MQEIQGDLRIAADIRPDPLPIEEALSVQSAEGLARSTTCSQRDGVVLMLCLLASRVPRPFQRRCLTSLISAIVALLTPRSGGDDDTRELNINCSRRPMQLGQRRLSAGGQERCIAKTAQRRDLCQDGESASAAEVGRDIQPAKVRSLSGEHSGDLWIEL